MQDLSLVVIVDGGGRCVCLEIALHTLLPRYLMVVAQRVLPHLDGVETGRQIAARCVLQRKLEARHEVV